MSAIDDLISKQVIFQGDNQLDYQAVTEIYNLLYKVEKEIKLYIYNLSGVDSYLFSLTMPAGSNIKDIKGNPNIVDNETVHLPYGHFSLQLLRAMQADKENCPVFKLVDFFSENINKLYELLINSGVVNAEKPELLITLDMLKKAGITDVLSLHTCVSIYFNFF